MPYKAPKPCAYPYCPNLTHSRYCDEHTRQVERQRGTRQQRGYDKHWIKIRDWYLAHNPLCEECGKPATEVHHKTPLRDGGTHSEENLQALCKPCHSRITIKESSGWNK